MKKVILSFAIAAVALTTAACNPGEDIKNGAEEVKKVIDVKAEADQYIDQHNALVDKQIVQMTTIEEKFVLVEDYDEALSNLSTIVIPEFKVFLDEVTAISYETEEIQQVHQYFSDAMQLQYDILLDYEQAMKEENDELFAQADAKVDEMNALLTQNEEKFMELAEQYSVNVELEE